MTIAPLAPEYEEALHSYALEYGRNWKDHLSLDWYRARAIGNRGALLHALRNSPGFGVEGLAAYQLPAEIKAKLKPGRAPR
jgi:hypothetical protein